MKAPAFSVGNGMCEGIDEPTPEEMRDFLFAIDASDQEHGAAWLTITDTEATSNGMATVDWCSTRAGAALNLDSKRRSTHSCENVLVRSTNRSATNVKCRHPGCERGAVELSVLCRVHHYEAILGRACPFTH